MAKSIEGKTVYFAIRGKENTEAIAQIVAERIGSGDISAIAVATTTGYTALTIAKSVPTGTPIYGINFQNSSKLNADIKEEAESFGVTFMPDKPVAKYLKDIDGHSPDTLRCFGQGMKVAVEVVMQAVEVGYIKSGDRVVGVGGSSRGADVAIVAQAAGPENVSDMWISEVLAKPH